MLDQLTGWLDAQGWPPRELPLAGGCEGYTDLAKRVIVIIGGRNAESETDFRHPETRHKGYTAAMQEHTLPAPDEWFYPTDFTIAGGYVAAKDALSDLRRPLSAQFAASDEMAIGAILAARDLGIGMPDKVSIVGIDGHDLAEFFGLTTVAQAPKQQGAHAAEIVLEILRGGPRELADEQWPIELIVRSTTARHVTSER